MYKNFQEMLKCIISYGSPEKHEYRVFIKKQPFYYVLSFKF